MGHRAQDGLGSRTRSAVAYSDTLVSADTASALLLRALRHEERGDLVAARALYRKVAEVEELAAVALEHCARIERELGTLDSAVRSLTEALHYCVDDQDRSCDLYVELGDVHAQGADWLEAAYYYRRALVYAPDRVDVQRRLRGALRLKYCGYERSA